MLNQKHNNRQKWATTHLATVHTFPSSVCFVEREHLKQTKGGSFMKHKRQ